MNSNLPAAVPEIPVTLIDRSISYYQDNLGFNIDWFEESIGLAGVSRGDCRLFLADRSFRQVYGNVGPIMIWLNLDSKQAVDELHREWSASGAIVRSIPESKAFGLHEFVAEDPDGNLFRVFYDFRTAEHA